MWDLDDPVRNGNVRVGTGPGEDGGRMSARGDRVPVVPADRLLDVASALSEGASQMHARLRHLDPGDRNEILELVANQVSEIVALWVDLVRHVVTTHDEPLAASSRQDRAWGRAGAPAPGPLNAPPPRAGSAYDLRRAPGPEHEEESGRRGDPGPGPERWEVVPGPEVAGHDPARPAIDRRTRDELTGVLNRQAGLSALSREVERCRSSNERLVLGFLNVDRLKALNESKGPRAGDEILRKVASALRATLRSYDVVVRLGGDEFLFSLPGADMATAEMRFNEFSVLLGEEAPGTTASVGLAEMRDRDTLDDLIARADATLVKNRRSLRRTR